MYRPADTSRHPAGPSRASCWPLAALGPSWGEPRTLQHGTRCSLHWPSTPWPHMALALGSPRVRPQAEGRPHVTSEQGAPPHSATLLTREMHRPIKKKGNATGADREYSRLQNRIRF